MTSIAELLPRAGRLKYEIMVQLQRVERGEGDASDCSFALRELERQLETLQSLLVSERPEKRALWQLKIDELRHERNFLAKDLQKYLSARSTALERDRLFHRRSGASTVSIDVLAEEGDSLKRSTSQIDELMETGSASLGSLRLQRERLKATHRNALSMIHTLGLSNSVMRMIQSREKNDRYIVYAGMAICLIVFYFSVRFARG